MHNHLNFAILIGKLLINLRTPYNAKTITEVIIARNVQYNQKPKPEEPSFLKDY